MLRTVIQILLVSLAFATQGYETLDNLPVIYVTDGQWYTREGDMHLVIDEEIAEGRISPVIAVFVDNRDPYDPANNRRNSQFFCNKNYARFFEEELVPLIDSGHKTSAVRDDRVILGLSFGGLNSACFGIDTNTTFAGIAMQSPALHPVKDLQERYEQANLMPLKFFHRPQVAPAVAKTWPRGRVPRSEEGPRLEELAAVAG
jgi:enterochelin esterase-like enzyme